MQAVEDGAAGQRSAADPFSAVPVGDDPQPAARPGTVKPQLAAETLRLYAGDWARGGAPGQDETDRVGTEGGVLELAPSVDFSEYRAVARV